MSMHYQIVAMHRNLCLLQSLTPCSLVFRAMCALCIFFQYCLFDGTASAFLCSFSIMNRAFDAHYVSQNIFPGSFCANVSK